MYNPKRFQVEDPNEAFELMERNPFAKELTAHTERHWPSGWDFFVPSDLTEETLPKSIVGFQIKIDRIEFKRKLSQNRTPEDRLGVLKGLETRSDDASRAVLANMLDIYALDGEKK